MRVATSKDRGATWKTASVGTSAAGTSSNKAGYPAVAVSGTTVAVTWTSSNTGAIKTRISTDHGVTWGTTQTVASASNGTFATAVRGTRVAVTWAGAAGVALRQRIAGTWGSPVVVAPTDGDHPQYAPAIALPDSSRIGIAWTRGRGDGQLVEPALGRVAGRRRQLVRAADARVICFVVGPTRQRLGVDRVADRVHALRRLERLDGQHEQLPALHPEGNRDARRDRDGGGDARRGRRADRPGERHPHVSALGQAGDHSPDMTSAADCGLQCRLTVRGTR